MLTLRLASDGNSLNGAPVDAAQLRVVDFLEVEEGGKVVEFAVNGFVVAVRRALYHPEREQQGWKLTGKLSMKEEGGSAVRISSPEGSLCHPFTLPLNATELLTMLDAGSIQRQQILDLVTALRVESTTRTTPKAS